MGRSFARISSDRLLSAFFIAAASSFLLCGYEFVRSVSQSLYIGAFGAARLPLVMALGPLGTLGLVALYGLLLSYAGARRAILYSSLVAAWFILQSLNCIIVSN